MNHTLLRSIVVLAVAALLVAGCSDKPAGTQGPSGDATSVKTMDEYRAEAAKEITRDNAETELDKLEKEIDADR